MEKRGFAHFDQSHSENFNAALLLLAMEEDEAVGQLVAHLACSELEIADSPPTAFGREARLEQADDDTYARVDIWIRFEPATGPFVVFIEVKTHNNWDAVHVANQVKDQARRRTARARNSARGCVLLAPTRLCDCVRRVDNSIAVIKWRKLIDHIQPLQASSPVAKIAIRHFLEQNMDRTAGIDRPMTQEDFEQATTTLACLREFIVGCILEIGGRVRGDPLWLTPGDGQPRQGGGWAWHGLSVPFQIDGTRWRLGIYKYAQVPAGEQSAMDCLWLEAYPGDSNDPVALIRFAPATLAAAELDQVRADFLSAWASAYKTTTAR